MKLKRNYWLDKGDDKGPMYAAYFQSYPVAEALAVEVGAEVRTGPDLVSFNQLIMKALNIQDLYPAWSYGQCMYNALDRLAPDIANRVWHTEADPTLDDTRINAMVQRFFKERG